VTLAALLPPAGLPPGSHRGDTVLPDLLRPLEVNRYVLWGLRPAAAYTALVRPADGKFDRTQWMRVAGVQWAWTPGGWSSVSQPMPRVRLVSDWLIPRPDTDIRAVDVSRTALVDAPPGATAGAAGRAEVLEEAPGRLRIETDAPQPQLLVLTERFHSGWRATIDDRQVPLIRVNGDYLGCMVPAGRKQVTLVFAPASVRYGLWLTLAGIAWTLLMAWAVSVAYDPEPRAAAAPGDGAERSSALS
jgi:hypothetical protein